MATYQLAEQFFFSAKFDGLGDTSSKAEIQADRPTGLGGSRPNRKEFRNLKDLSAPKTNFKARTGRSKRNNSLTDGPDSVCQRKHNENRPKCGYSSKKSESMLHLPTVNTLKGRSFKESRLYVSTPVLGPTHSRREQAGGVYLQGNVINVVDQTSASFPLRNTKGDGFYLATGKEHIRFPKLGPGNNNHINMSISSSTDDVTNAADDTEREAEAAEAGTGSADDRKRAAVLEAEEDVKHNWVLEEELKENERRFKHRQKALNVHVPDEDPLVAIEKRLDEIRQMSKPRLGEDNVLQKVESSKRDYILVSQ